LITIAVATLLGSGAALAASNACKADLNGDLVVNFADLAVLKSVFFQRCNDPGSMCGDDVAQGPTEECDDGNVLNGDGCSSICMLEPARHFPATGQTTCWDAAGAPIPSCRVCRFVGGSLLCEPSGHDGEIQAGATLAYVDNGDGTITDTNTGLMWEKLSNDGTIHDWDNTYTWDDAFAVKVATLNGGSGFAGHTDWRVPNYKELESILNLGTYNPAVSAAFNTGWYSGCTVTSCSCTLSADYWSSSSLPVTSYNAWRVNFDIGGSSWDDKAFNHSVRAVRGGL